MKKDRFVIRSENEESFAIELNGKHVISANHDEDGWNGMTKTRDTIHRIAEILGIVVDDER